MRQRLALAAALLGEPRILILDEPANAGDALAARPAAGAGGRGRTVVSSHLLSEVAQTADELAMIAAASWSRSPHWPISPPPRRAGSGCGPPTPPRSPRRWSATPRRCLVFAAWSAGLVAIGTLLICRRDLAD